MGLTSCLWWPAGELPGWAGTAHPRQEPLGAGGVDRSLERWVSWTDGTSAPLLAGTDRVHGTAEGKFTACSALHIGWGDSGGPALKPSRLTLSSPHLIISLLLLQLLRVGQHRPW